MKSWPSVFTTYKNRTDGPEPVWILRLTVAGVDYWLCDNALTIPGFTSASPWPQNTVVNTLDWVKSWGNLQQGISTALGEFTVSEFSFTGLIAPGISPNLETLALAGIEQNNAELYEWFVGCADPPQRVFVGRVRDISDLTDTTVSISIQDLSILAEKCYIGEKVALSTYPQAAPADVGRVIPIPFGPVAKIPALALSGCAQTTLTVACGAGDTSIYMADKTRLVPGMVLLVESEQIYVSGIGTVTATVVRGYNATTAAAHAKGSAVVQATDQVYVLSWRPVTGIPRVWLRLSDDQDMDITAYCTLYSGQAGSQLSGYGSRAVALLTIAGQQSILDIIQLRQTDTIGVTTGSHDHTAQNTKQQAANDIGTTYGGSTYTSVTVAPSFVATQNIVEQTCTYAFAYGGDASARNVYVNGILLQSGFSANDRLEWSGTTVGQPSIYVTGGMGTWVKILSGTMRSVTYLADTTYSPATGVAKTGTAQMTGSSMTTYFGSGKLFADLVADGGSPAGIITWLGGQCGLSPAAVAGAINPSCVAMAGVIQEYETALTWFNRVGFQAGCWFVVRAGVPTLVVRPVTVPVKTIAACLVDDSGLRQVSRNKTNIDDVLNTVTVLYRRDFSKSGDDAYAATCGPLLDAASQAVYGERERPELFKMDFVTDDAMARYLGNLYLAECAARRWLAVFPVPLMHSELEFGDGVTLGFLGASGTVVAAEQAPGSSEKQDVIILTIRY